MLDLEFTQLSDPGRVRDQNEDYLGQVTPLDEHWARAHGWLFALADGVGGQDHGEVASRIAVESLLGGFKKAACGDALTSLLPRLVQSANTQVYEKSQSTGRGSNMATTLVACALRYDRAIVSHAGDSRCYLIRQGYAASLTRDHTVANEQRRLGLITSREAAKSQSAHVLSRSLGNNMFLSVDTSENQLLPDDVLVLCSDGLHHSLDPGDLAQLAGRGGPLPDCAAGLVALAKERDGSDNISVLLIRVRGVERVGMYRGRHYKLH